MKYITLILKVTHLQIIRVAEVFLLHESLFPLLQDLQEHKNDQKD